MSPMAFEVMAATALIVLALFAAPRYLKSGITTIPQLLGELDESCDFNRKDGE